MTASRFFLYLFLAAAVLFAIFVWPTRYRDLPAFEAADGGTMPGRVDRLTSRVEVQNAAGEWTEYVPPPPPFDPKETAVGHGVDKAKQATDDIRKMNEVAKEAVEQGTLGK